MPHFRVRNDFNAFYLKHSLPSDSAKMKKAHNEHTIFKGINFHMNEERLRVLPSFTDEKLSVLFIVIRTPVP
jgi:hypothetical protein